MHMLARGAIAETVATIPMTLVMTALFRRLPVDHPRQRKTLMLAAHVVWGAALAGASVLLSLASSRKTDSTAHLRQPRGAPGRRKPSPKAGAGGCVKAGESRWKSLLVSRRGTWKMRSLATNRKRGIDVRRMACNSLLLHIAFLCAPVLAQEQDQLVNLINAYRALPGACAGSPQRAAGPLSPEPRLATVNLSQGGEQALRAAGLHVVRMEAISVAGPSNAAAAMQAIRSRFCKALAKPEYTMVGASRNGDTWRIVLARPRLAQDPAELAGAGREILDLVNAARAKPRTCGATRYRAAPPLAWNAALADAALAHSSDMADKDYFAHEAPDGSRAGERARQAGYRWRQIGENIAAGQDSAKSAVDGWLASPGHCANLMRAHFTEMGAAHAINRKSDMLIYWTQVFGTPR